MIAGDSFTLYDTGPNLLFPLRVSMHDAFRMPVYGFFWRIAGKFLQPSQAALWVNFFGISITMALWYGALFGVTKKQSASAVLSTISLVLITFSMRQFYVGGMALDDSLFSSFAFSGLLLVFLGYVFQKKSATFAGMGVLGLAIFTKPIGVCLLPLWIPFVLWESLRFSNIKKRGMHILICVLLLLGPMTLWSARQYALYGFFRSNAFGAVHLLANVLPFVEQDDILLENTEHDTQFKESLLLFEDIHGKDRIKYLWYDRVNSKGANPFVQLELQNNLFVNPNLRPRAYVQSQFAVAEIAMNVALRIIRLHPRQYIHMTLQNFWDFFPFEANAIQESLEDTYRIRVKKIEKLPFYFPPDGTPRLSERNANTQALLTAYCCNNSVRTFLQKRKTAFSYGVMILFLWHGIGLYKQRKRRESALYASFLLGFLLLSQTILYYALTSATAFPVDRYATVGEPGLLFATVLGIYSATVTVLRLKHR